ncbi:helix-turn-helix domain-containing protein [Paracoccus benzoatiresistens]|uniref:Helix-turn-helix domain-containing protein n=1 Tax=Paracoccus benzoatiresistens TaxID=2997341 RepID=A0ABT4JA13_9RHOB|nr:helix-turn-helix domain-containing protein [Paracoccus sp. EF6]MCZ0963910.1 helix-turn-helix domain-containing protein [Paracoccus sp. EF6]
MSIANEIIAPGDFIRRKMEEQDWTQSDLAFALGTSTAAVNQILSNKRAISAGMASALAVVLELDAKEIAKVQAEWDIETAGAPDPSITSRSKILRQYPLREMMKRGWIDTKYREGTLEEQVCRFFNVSSLDEVPHLAHAARKSRYDRVPPAQLAWLFRVEAIALEMVTPRYNVEKLKAAVDEFAKLKTKTDGVRHVPRVLEEAGVRFVVVEGLPKAEIDGACFWLDNASPVIGMAMRYDRIDNFWFVLRHECAHVLHGHGKNEAIVDCDVQGQPSRNVEEEIANREAADFCVPVDRMNNFYLRKKPYFAEKEVEAFARIVGTHPGLVVGQLQHKMGRYDFLRKHLVKVRDTLSSSMMMDGWGNLVPTER